MDHKKNREKETAAIIADCLEIRNSYEQVKARELIIELFKGETADQEETVSLMLKTIGELKNEPRDEMQSETDAAQRNTELIGELYEIAIELSTGDARNDLTRDLTFFYLAAGSNPNFIRWCDILLNTIQKDNVEYRATLFAIGAAQIFVDQWDKAKGSFERLLKDFPDAAEGYFGLALIYLKLGDRIHFENALELTRKLAPELGKIIDRFSNQGDFSINDYIREMSSLDNQDD